MHTLKQNDEGEELAFNRLRISPFCILMIFSIQSLTAGGFLFKRSYYFLAGS